ncbi:hypothetical protein RGZ1_115 [Morganella phage vB_MmoM_Rgz1]|nr:hypothetical protein RGZ1_115 [Morganella phage vB_MmoM_Rgz1]
MKIKTFGLMFLTTLLGVVLSYISFSLTFNPDWSTYEFLNANKEYGVTPFICGSIIGFFALVNLISSVVYVLPDQDLIDETAPRWFIGSYVMCIVLCSLFALVVYSFSSFNAIFVVLAILICVFGLVFIIRFFDEIKTFFKDKFGKEDKKDEIEESEWARQRKERCVRDYVKHCRGK